MEKVILVDVNDNQIGLMEKMEAHEKALLHRAFSVFVFNSKGEMLLQKRAATKYHCAGMWANTCCSHQREHESDLDAATRRLKEEMGIETPLYETFSFIYKAELDNNLTEHEFDHVFFGESMFHYETDASKIAFVLAVQYLKKMGVKMIDCQMKTKHLLSFGAKEITRNHFIQLLNTYIKT